MNWLFRPERGGFLFLRVVGAVLCVVGLLMTLSFLTLAVLTVAVGVGGPMTGVSAGVLGGQMIAMTTASLVVVALGHVLRALALGWAKRFGDTSGVRAGD